ncbi:MAG: CaiB/BaiF CoA-transferase family protein, partial [Pseudomonadota bacterium]
GYGGAGPWRGKPGQDLLVQALSGMTWLSGNREDGPVPVGFSVLDITAGNHLTQGILAALVRRGVTGRGGLVEVSLLASALDLQFEQITAFANAASAQPQRSAVANASVHGAAPYGIFATKDGHLALAMMPIAKLADLIQAPALAPYLDPAVAFSQRDEIKAILSDHLATRTSREWLAVLEPADVWCAEVLDWPALMAHPGLAAIDPMQTIPSGGSAMTTTRCPIRMDGSAAPAGRGAPRLGEHTDAIRRELDR